MTPEQEIRAVAIQAAASFCAPISGVAARQIPNLDDVLFVADVFYGYVQGGWEEALRIDATSEKQQQESHVKSVELREQTPAQGTSPSRPEPQPEPPAPVPPTPEPASTNEGETPIADIIPIEARGVVTKEQSSARRAVDRIKRKRAEKIVNEFKVAKVEEHRQRLREEAEESGLLGFLVTVNGRELELGSYLASL